MKLRASLLIVFLLAGAIWYAQARGGRPGVERVPASTERPSPAPGEELDLEPAPAPAPRAPIVAADASARSPLPVEPPRVQGAERGAPTSRGRLVDEATLEPIADALVVTRERNSRTDAQGWFDTGEALDELDEVDVLNVARSGSVHEVPRERWTKLADGWQVPLAIGPTYRLRLFGLSEPIRGPWEGRLMREPRDDMRWMPLEAGALPYLRYDAPVSEREDAGALWVEVRSLDGLHEGRGDARSLVGVQEVEIACRERAVVRGRVVDARGTPCSDVRVEATLLQTSATEWLQATTGRDGSYQLGASEPGTLDLVVLAPLETKLPRLRLELRRGLVQAPAVVLANAEPAGAIRGRVRCRSGDGPVDATVRLRALDGSRFTQETGVGLGFRTLAEQHDRTKNGEVKTTIEHGRIDAQEFVFENVPRGAFELSVVTKQGFACSPATIRVAAPAAGLVFDCDDRVPLRSYRLVAVDAESRQPLEPVAWLARVEAPGLIPMVRSMKGEATLELADGASFEWWALSPGHRLGHGTAGDFQSDGAVCTATCALQRGFGVRLVLHEWSGALALLPSTAWTDVAPRNAPRRTQASTRWDPCELAGAAILADGVAVATSDEHGIAELDLLAEPKRIDVRLAGWRVLDSPWFHEGRAEPYPEAEVWMVRE